MTLESNTIGLVPLINTAIALNSLNFLYANNTLEYTRDNLTSFQDTLESNSSLMTNIAYGTAAVCAFSSISFVANQLPLIMPAPTLLMAVTPTPLLAIGVISLIGINLYFAHKCGSTVSDTVEYMLNKTCNFINAHAENNDDPLINDEETDQETSYFSGFYQSVSDYYAQPSAIEAFNNSLYEEDEDGSDDQSFSLIHVDTDSDTSDEDWEEVCETDNSWGLVDIADGVLSMCFNWDI